jgi:hypothetical protein
LSAAAAEVWRDTVGTLPAGWFTLGQYPIVMAYCRHAAQADELAKQADAFEPEWLKADGGLDRLNKLLAMAERETRAMTACARAMRITKQSQIEPRGAGRRMAGALDAPRPWDFADEGLPIGQDPMFDDYEGER